MAACLGLPREVTVQQWTMSLHLPSVAARLALVDPEVRPRVDMLGFRLGQGMEVRSVRLPSPMTPSLLEGLRLTRPEGAGVWTEVHCQLLGWSHTGAGGSAA